MQFYRQDQTKVTDWKQAQKQINTLVASSLTICGNVIRPEYIKTEALPLCNAMILCFKTEMSIPKTRHQKPTAIQNLCGFVLLRLNDSNKTVYLDVICARDGSGSAILEEVYLQSRKGRYKLIFLAALSSAIPYWLKKGFVYGKGHDMPQFTAIRDTSQIAQLRLADDKVAERHPVMRPLLNYLLERGVSNNCHRVDGCEHGYFMHKKL